MWLRPPAYVDRLRLPLHQGLYPRDVVTAASMALNTNVANLSASLSTRCGYGCQHRDTLSSGTKNGNVSIHAMWLRVPAFAKAYEQVAYIAVSIHAMWLRVPACRNAPARRSARGLYPRDVVTGASIALFVTFSASLALSLSTRCGYGCQHLVESLKGIHKTSLSTRCGYGCQHAFLALVQVLVLVSIHAMWLRVPACPLS